MWIYGATAGANNMAPIPGMDRYDQFHARADWDYVFVWWPKQCELTNRQIWLQHAYRGTAVWVGPGEPVFEYRYHAPQEHLIWQLQQ